VRKSPSSAWQGPKGDRVVLGQVVARRHRPAPLERADRGPHLTAALLDLGQRDQHRRDRIGVGRGGALDGLLDDAGRLGRVPGLEQNAGDGVGAGSVERLARGRAVVQQLPHQIGRHRQIVVGVQAPGPVVQVGLDQGGQAAGLGHLLGEAELVVRHRAAALVVHLHREDDRVIRPQGRRVTLDQHPARRVGVPHGLAVVADPPEAAGDDRVGLGDDDPVVAAAQDPAGPGDAVGRPAAAGVELGQHQAPEVGVPAVAVRLGRADQVGRPPRDTVMVRVATGDQSVDRRTGLSHAPDHRHRSPNS